MDGKFIPLGSLAQQLALSAALLVLPATMGADSVQAETDYQVIEIAIAGRSQSDMVRQAEALARAEVMSQFSANPQLTEVHIDVLGQRHGQVAPILSTRVSRQQWQTTPQIESWTQYYGVAYALLNPSGSQGSGPELVAAAPTRLQVAGQEDPSVALDQMVRDGRIDYDEYLELVDAVD
ncbi:hypothetical protein C7271_00055 [filamentous cyanobacterium CCP5]|nr:hypothetical protein C7271_00055 [filamentous cyanobacterium CCP5]